MRVYDGESLREVDPRAKSMQEYKDAAGVDEGMDGVSTRFAFKALSATFNHDPSEITADPVHLMYVLERMVRQEQLPEIGSASCRERVGKYVAILVVAGTLKKKK